MLMTGAPALGQPIQLPWSTAAGGGTTSTSGILTLSSSIGQPVATAALTQGNLTLEGGFIPGIRLLAGTSASFAQQAAMGWNMVSVPLLVSIYQKSVLYPDAASNAYYYSGGYAITLTLVNGAGYWLQYASPASVAMSGTAFVAETLQVLQNWNMIGPPSYPVLKSSVVGIGTSILSQFFCYKNGFGYLVADTLQPGNAYWVQVSGNGSLILSSGGFARNTSRPSVIAQSDDKGNIPGSPLLTAEQAEEIKDFSSMCFTDATGLERDLFYSDATPDIDLSSYALPPVAPDMLMDVRFASHRIVEVAGKTSVPESFPVYLSGGVYPVSVTWQNKGKSSHDALVLIDGYGRRTEYPLSKPGKVNIPNEEAVTGMRLILSGSSGKAIPKVFALYQNYPNPFNPSTMIRYDVPKSAHVELNVFNILGEEVLSLVHEDQEAGSYDVQFSGGKFSSGMYFYRLKAGNYLCTKKFVLVK